MKRNYFLKKQEKPYYCIPACLQAVLYEYDINLEQKEIANKINCTDRGANLVLDPAKNFMDNLGFKLSYFNWDEIANDARETFLETNSDVLVTIPNLKDRPHVLLLEEFKDPILYVLDPDDVKLYELDLFQLTNLMRDKHIGGFGLIEKLNI